MVMPTRMPSQPVMWERKSRGRKETLTLNLRSELSSSPFGPGFAILQGCCSVTQPCLKWQVSHKGQRRLENACCTHSSGESQDSEGSEKSCNKDIHFV